jgi:hypothetical protein
MKYPLLSLTLALTGLSAMEIVYSAGNVFPSTGNVGIGTTSPQSPLHIDFQTTGSIRAGTPIGNGPGWIFFAPNGHRRDIVGWIGGVYIGASANTGAGQPSQFMLRENGNVGIGTVTPAAKLDVKGTARVQRIQITGGSDLAEPFEVTGAKSVEPGMVVSIDPEEQGRLRISNRPYDHRVAGIVSGANGLNSGLVMAKDDQSMNDFTPVALSGRVYCWADAAFGEIKPGDLLTTSSTPGHTMKVTNPVSAQGAIIGKAMTPLKEGRGLILVLVALQ